MKISSIRIIIFPLYIIILFMGILYIKSVLSEKSVDVINKPNEEKSEDTRTIEVKINIDYTGAVTTYTGEYKNSDSILSILEDLRDSGQIYYEKISYVYGPRIINLNNIELPDNLEWRVLLNDTDVTNDIENILVNDNSTITLKLMPIN